MKPHHEHFNIATEEARYSIELPLNAPTVQENSRIKQSIGVAALAVAGLTLSQTTIAVSLPLHIQSSIRVDELVETTPNTYEFRPITSGFRDFSTNNLPLVVQSGNGRSNFGSGYADAQNQWGNKANQSSYTPGGNGIAATSFYGATFIKENNSDVLHTRISNTKLSILDFGSGSNISNSFAIFDFSIFAQSGSFVQGEFDVTNATELFAKSVTLQGETGFHGGTLSNPNAGPFTLSGDVDFFPGSYSEFQPFNAAIVNGAEYVLDTTEIEISLADFNIGETFSITWRANSSVRNQQAEGTTEIQFWDPISGTPGTFFEIGPSTSPVPVPAAIWLFVAGLLGLVSVGSRGSRD